MNFFMWTKSVFKLCFLFPFFGFFFCFQIPEDAKSAEERPINNEMQSMAEDVQKLIPYLFSEEKFKADKYHETINGSLRCKILSIFSFYHSKEIQHKISGVESKW